MSTNENLFDLSRNWIMHGLTWSLIMYLFSVLLFPYVIGEDITTRRIFIGILIWLTGGLVYGYVIKMIINRQRKSNLHS